MDPTVGKNRNPYYMSIPGRIYPVFCWLVAVMHINTTVCVEEWIYVLCPSALIFGNPICIEMHAGKERMGKRACVCVLSPVAVCGTCFSMPDLFLWVIFMVSSCLILNILFHPCLIIQSAGSQMFPGHGFIKYRLTDWPGAHGMVGQSERLHMEI